MQYEPVHGWSQFSSFSQNNEMYQYQIYGFVFFSFENLRSLSEMSLLSTNIKIHRFNVQTFASCFYVCRNVVFVMLRISALTYLGFELLSEREGGQRPVWGKVAGKGGVDLY